MFYSLLQKFPNDTGPIYQETLQGQIPVEPFNTFSNLFFIAILIYFFKRIYKQPRNHPFFLFAIPVIFISWIGGTMYHGTRSHEFWLVLDWLPIMVVCFGAVIYFIGKVCKGWFFRMLMLLIAMGLFYIPRVLPIPESYRISSGYSITALTVLAPIFWYVYITNWKRIEYVLKGILFFLIAITFRTLDNLIEILPMGTHWLWHSFAALAVFNLLQYIYLDREKVIANL